MGRSSGCLSTVSRTARSRYSNWKRDTGRLSCCHLANIAYLTGRKVQWDGDKEAIAKDAEATRLLDRPRRKGYELP